MSLPPPSPVAPPHPSSGTRDPLPPPTRPSPGAAAAPRAWPDLPPAVARRAVAGALVVGALADLAVRHGYATVAGALAVALTPLVLGALARVRHRWAWACLAVPVLLAPFSAWRASEWLVPLNVAVAGMALMAGAGWGRGGVMADGVVDLVARLGAVVARAAGGPWWAWAHVRRTVPAGRGRIDRGALIAVLRALPLVALLALLLVWGDALLASWVRLPTGLPSLTGHAVVVVAGAVAFFGLHRAAVTVIEPADRSPVPAARVLERIVLVAGAVAVELVFVAAQAVAALAGDDYVQARTGLTYADHARRGFFQLLAAAALALGIVLAARRALAVAQGRARRVLRALAVALVVLTLVLVAVAVQRLRLYEDAYGLTMLRLYATVFAVWVGAVLALVGVACAWPAAAGRRWLVPSVAATALAGLVGVNVADPEAVVVRHNVASAERTGRLDDFDVAYLVSLSSDAVPALVDAARTASPAVGAPVRAALCEPWVRARHGDAGTGVATNRSERRAQRALASLCGP